MISDELYKDASVAKIKPSWENISPLSGCLSILAFDQSIFFRELTDHGHKGISSVCDKGKSEYEIECWYKESQ